MATLTLTTVSDISTLEATSGGSNQAVLVTDPNRGGTFLWASGGSLDIDDGLIFDANGTGNTWVRQFADSISVTWFGADPSGSQDATTTFSDAIKASQNVGIECFIPPGTYKINNLHIKGSVRLRGAGKEETTLMVSTTDATCLKLDAVSSGGVAERSELSDFSINGDSKAGYGIYIHDGAGIRATFRNVTVHECRGTPGIGIANEDRAWSALYDRISAYDNEIGVKLVKRAQHTQFTSCLLYGNYEAQLHLGDFERALLSITLIGCQLERGHHGSSDTVNNLVVNGVDPLTIIGSYMETHSTSSSRLIKFERADTSQQGVSNIGSRVFLQGCYANCGDTALQVDYAVDFPDNCERTGDNTPVYLEIDTSIIYNSKYGDDPVYLSSDYPKDDRIIGDIFKHIRCPRIFLSLKNSRIGGFQTETIPAYYALPEFAGGFGVFQGNLKKTSAFDASEWVKSDCTVTANAEDAPDGSQTVDKLDFANTSSSYIQQDTSLTSTANEYGTFSVWLQSATGNPGEVTLRIFTTGAQAESEDLVVYLSDKAPQRVRITKKFEHTGGDIFVRIFRDTNQLQHVYAWGAAYTRTPMAEPYVSMFAQAQNSNLKGLVANRLLGSDQLRGAKTIADTNTTATVTFPIAEPDTNYFILTSVSGTSGAPASGATRTFVTNKTTAGFTVNLEAAPGSGNNVTVDWLMLR